MRDCGGADVQPTRPVRTVHSPTADRKEASESSAADYQPELGETIDDYFIHLYYASGICDGFMKFLLEAMQGTFFQQTTAEPLCQALLRRRLPTSSPTTMWLA